MADHARKDVRKGEESGLRNQSNPCLVDTASKRNAMKILLTIAYDGTNYCGWARQKNGIAIQEKLEDVLLHVYGTPVTLVGASRTDAGVHALGQRAMFTIGESHLPIPKLPLILNRFLPEDIRVIDAKHVKDVFHVRYHAKAKTYCYTISHAPFPNPLQRHAAWHIHVPLNVANMQKASALVIGKHDFVCFCAAGGSAKTTVRTIFDCHVTQKGEGDIVITVTGDGFLYNMVRILTGTLVYVGMGKMASDAITDIIKSGDRTLAGKTAPPHGLVLKEIFYSEGR
jgi:tRNA pseudouridine38-40 synthase